MHGSVNRRCRFQADGLAARAIESLVDDLSRWYIRRSRQREEAIRVLGYVLLRISQMMAPFAPFFSDAIVDLCETGASLKQNGLIPLYAVRKSTVHLYAHNQSMAYGWKRREIEKICKSLTQAVKKLPKNPKRMLVLPNVIS